MGMGHGAGGSTRMKRKTIMTGSRQSTAQLAVGECGLSGVSGRGNLCFARQHKTLMVSVIVNSSDVYFLPASMSLCPTVPHSLCGCASVYVVQKHCILCGAFIIQYATSLLGTFTPLLRI